MFHQSSKRILLGIIVALLLMTMPVYAVENFKVSNYGGGHQIWFEVEDFDERNPADDSRFALSDEPGAFGRSINSLDVGGDGSGYIRYTFDISTAGGTGGTWYFWGRVINPDNSSDFMLVEGHPGDQVPFTLPVSGLTDDQRIFESTEGPPWIWTNPNHEESHTKTLQDGENTMYILNRQSGALWDVFMWTDDPSYVPTDDDYLNALPGKPTPLALRPDPKDGDMHEETWVSLSWRPGAYAVSHDVYLGDNFDDVNNGAGDTFRGRQGNAVLTAGYFGVPYPDGLVPGTTYYWRIDEVNDADPNSPWKGDVWSFRLPPTNTYAPSPSDGGRFVDPDVTLSWSAGLNAIVHYVHFGDNFDDVNNAAVGTPSATTTFAPGTLELGKTYYWRVDEFTPPTTMVTGNVWSFTTLPDIPITDPNLVAWWKFEAGEGTKVIDFSGHGNHGDIVDNVLWVPGQFNLALEFLGDNEGHVELPARMVTTASGSVVMWVNTNQTGNEGMFWYGTETGGDGFGGENEIHVHNQDSGGLGFGLEGSTDIRLDGPMLAGAGWNHVAVTWDLTDGCRLYFNGIQVDFQGHNNTVADLAVIRLGRPVSTGNGNRYHDGLLDDVRLFDHAITAEQVSEIMTKGEDPRRAGALNPANGAVAPINLATPLSWSPGENATQHDVYFGLDKDTVANADASDATGIYRGQQVATSFTPAEVELGGGPYYWRIDEVASDGAIVEGGVWSFSVADYVLVENFESYNDIEAGLPGSNLIYETWLDGYGTTTNGSAIGYTVAFQPTMETGTVHGGQQSAPLEYNNTTAAFSEAARTLPAQNWTDNGVQTLSLWFFGDVNNVPGQLYVKVNGVKVPYDGEAGNLRVPAWQPWNIDLALIGVNLQSVTSLAIGVEGAFTAGTLLLDDIRLYPYPRELITPVQPDPNGLVGSWGFDGDYNDASGNGRNGTPVGAVGFAFDPVRGQVLSLPGGDDQYVDIGSVGISGNMPKTIACWAKADSTVIPDWSLIFGFTGQTDGSGDDGSHFNVGSLGGPGGVGAHVWGWEETIFSDQAALSWHHYAMTYDGTTIQYYGDGILMDTDTAKSNVRDLSLSADRVHVGSRITQTSSFPGKVDDARIYNRVLSYAEIAGLAGRTQPFDKPF